MTMLLKGTVESQPAAATPVTPTPEAGDFRTELAEKIFLDRYALKSSNKRDIAVGDVVVYCPNPHEDEKWRQREIGVVAAVHPERAEVAVRPRNDAQAVPLVLSMDYVDKPLELTWNHMAKRVATAIAQAESNDADRRRAEARFYEALANRTFIPGGRILAGAGAPGDLTFYNCFVIPSPKDSRKGILETAAQQFEIMSRGGGVGINVSSLRPRYDSVVGVNGRSSGAVSWADLYSFITGKVEQGGSRRGALMIIMDIWHPDVEGFIAAKRKAGVLDNANISVGISDAFMQAVEQDADWPLVFPDRTDPEYDKIWDGNLEAWKAAGKSVTTYRTVKARSLYDKICESAWASAEPGLFFVDRVNRYSNSHYYQPIRCTNPCGEQPLPPWGVCNLGALNLAEFVRTSPDGIQFWPTLGDDALDANSGGANGPARAKAEAIERALERVDFDKLRRMTQTGIHFLDNVIDSTTYFFVENERQQKTERRVGLGVMGLAELLVKIGVPYGSRLGLAVVDKVFETIRDSALDESVELARIKGPFQRFVADKFLESDFTRNLPERLRERIRNHGVRNVTLLTVAPTGTTGTMMATSTGIEPFFMFQFERRGRLGSHIVNEAVVTDYCREMGLAPTTTELPGQFRTTEDLSPLDHVEVMATAQKYVDSAISKTCNLPHDFSVEDVKTFYRKLYELGCKGGTVYRDRSREEQVLVKLPEAEPTAVAAAPQAPAKPVVIEPVKRLPPVPRQGFTHSVQTPIGRVHVTLNTEPGTASPFDVFVTLSKAGSDTDADTDAMGRLISLLLRLNVEIPSRTRLELAIEQIRGIATSRSVGFGPDRVRSVPDGIGRCLEKLLEHLDQSRPIAVATGTVSGESGQAAPGSGEGRARSSSASGGAFMQVCPDCGNATAANVDGCFKCFSCGYSEC